MADQVEPAETEPVEVCEAEQVVARIRAWVERSEGTAAVFPGGYGAGRKAAVGAVRDLLDGNR